jgi:hypothetical protein
MDSAAASAVVHVSYHMFIVSEDGQTPTFEGDLGSNGLVFPSRTDGGLFVWTGIHSGVVTVTAELLATSPPVEDAGWEEAVEVSLHAPFGRVMVACLMDDFPEGLPVLTPAGPGDYRVRVHALGRDTDIDGTAFEPFEDYLVQVWPGAPAPEVVYKQTDRYGAQIRESSLDSP